jgi:uncharacterized membrane protein HdeD (DUF308 family)
MPRGNFATTYFTRTAPFLILRGLLGLSLAAATFFMRNLSHHHRLKVLAAYAAFDGLVTLTAAIVATFRGIRLWRHGERELALFVEGVLGIAAAVMAFAFPVTPESLIRIIAIRAMFTGLIEVKAMRELLKFQGTILLLGAAGLMSIVFGLLLAIGPKDSVFFLTWSIRVYGTVYGINLLLLGVRFLKFPTAPTVQLRPT